EVIDQAELRVENPSPKENHRHAGRHVRNIEAGSEKTDPLQLLVQQKRNQKGKQQADGHGDQHVIQRIDQRFVEQVVFGESPDEVSDADERSRSRQIGVGKHHDERMDHRIEGEDQEAQQPRGNIKEELPVLPSFDAADSLHVSASKVG